MGWRALLETSPHDAAITETEARLAWVAGGPQNPAVVVAVDGAELSRGRGVAWGKAQLWS